MSEPKRCGRCQHTMPCDRADRGCPYPQEASQPPQGAEPLGEVVGTHKVGFAELATVAWAKGMPPVGTKLYAAPAPVSPEGRGGAQG